MLTKTFLSPQSDPHTAKLCFSVVLKHFWGYSQRTSLFITKCAISEKSTETDRKFVFLNIFEMVNPEENLDLFKPPILIIPVKRENINKNFCSPQSEPHTAKLSFFVVLKHFWENFQRYSFLVKKVTISERSTKILRDMFFLTCLKRINP